MSEGTRKLSEEELYQCLKSLNVPVRLSEVKTPTKEFIIRVFECCLKDLQIDIRSPNMRPWSIIKHIEHPEISEDAQMLTVLLYGINQITHRDGLLISLRDITDPKPKRTKKILNYLIVFWNYCMTKYALFQDIEEEFQEKKLRISELAIENEALAEKHDELVAVLNDMQSSNEDLNRIVAMNNDKIRNYENMKETDAANYQSLKKKEIDLKAQISEADVKKVSLKETIDELEEHILSSPEKFSDELQKMKELINEEDIKMKQKDDELKEKLKILEGLRVAQEENKKALNLLEKTDDVLIKTINTVNSLKSEMQKSKHEEEEIKKLQEELELKQEAKYSSEGNAVKVQLNMKKQIETYSETIKILKSNVAEELKCIQDTKTTSLELQQKADREADNVLEVIDLCKKAKDETEKLHIAFESQMNNSLLHFQAECNDMKNSLLHFQTKCSDVRNKMNEYFHQ